MSLLRVDGYSVSLDGFGAGPNQSLQHPLGVNGHALHGWLTSSRTFFREVLHKEGGAEGPDNDIAERCMANLGAWILGRNMFAHSRGPWTDDGWKGWWGDEPPYHVPTFVLTHHARPSIEMKGGTVFHFVTGGIHEALERAREAAGARDIRVGGGAATIRQYLQAKLIDRMHVALSPVLLGQGERLWEGVDLPTLGYAVSSRTQTEHATHIVIERR